MRMNVTMFSPVILVPRNATSKEKLWIELGKLTLKNNHVTERVKHVDISFEHMDIALSSMNIKNVLEGPNGLLTCSLLQDVNTEVKMIRLLQMEHKDKVAQIKVRTSRDDNRSIDEHSSLSDSILGRRETADAHYEHTE